MPKMRGVLAIFSLGTILCSAQSGAPGQPELELSLGRAIQIASESQQSAAVRRGEQIVNVAKSSYGYARANLLPSLDGAVAEQNQTVNLNALGLRFQPGPGLHLSRISRAFLHLRRTNSDEPEHPQPEYNS